MAANLPLFLEVLLPLGLSSPILTGDDIEQAIGRQRLLDYSAGISQSPTIQDGGLMSSEAAGALAATW